jgi:hypothetical protein
MAKTRLELVNICKRKTKDTSSTSSSGFQEDLTTAEGIISTILQANQPGKVLDTLSLTAGVESYSLASNVASVEQILITSPVNDEKEIIEVDKETFRRTNPATSNDSQSCPSYWYHIEPTISSTGVLTKKVSFYPIPDKSYMLKIAY